MNHFMVFIRLCSVPLSFILIYSIAKRYGSEGLAISAILSSLIPLSGLAYLGLDGAILQYAAKIYSKKLVNRKYISSLNFLIRIIPIISISLGLITSLFTYKWLGLKFNLEPVYYHAGIIFFFIGGVIPLLSQYYVCIGRKFISSILLPMVISMQIMFVLFGNIELEQLIIQLGLPYLITVLLCLSQIKVKIKNVNATLIVNLIKGSAGYNRASVYGLMTLGLDYVILANYVDFNAVAEYNLASRFYLLSLTVLNIYLLMNNMTVATSYFNKSTDDLKSMINAWRIKGNLFLLAYSLFLVLFSDNIISLLSTNSVSTSIVGHVLLIILIFIRFNSDLNYSILHSCNQTKTIVRLMLPQAVISLSLQIIFADIWGYYGVISGIIISFLLTQTWYLHVKLNKVLNNAQFT